jgi:cytoskeletal protein RodZ
MSSTDLKKYTPLIPVVAIILVGISFVAGMQVQKSITKSNAATVVGSANGGTTGGAGGFSGRGGRMGMRPTFGTVSSISGSNLTVTTDASTTVTVTLSSSTQITDGNGATATAGSIKTGDTIAAFGTTSSDGATITATRIRLNPAFGGAGGGNPQPGQSGASTL